MTYLIKSTVLAVLACGSLAGCLGTTSGTGGGAAGSSGGSTSGGTGVNDFVSNYDAAIHKVPASSALSGTAVYKGRVAFGYDPNKDNVITDSKADSVAGDLTLNVDFAKTDGAVSAKVDNLKASVGGVERDIGGTLTTGPKDLDNVATATVLGRTTTSLTFAAGGKLTDPENVISGTASTAMLGPVREEGASVAGAGTLGIKGRPNGQPDIILPGGFYASK